jgi:hypothetical protein
MISIYTTKQPMRLLVIVLLILFTPFFWVSAQTIAESEVPTYDPENPYMFYESDTPETENNQVQPILVATVNAQDLTLLEQDGHIVTLGFNISNREGVQPAVIYAVNLYEQSTDQVLNRIDQKVYTNDTLSLGENEKIHKEITYEAVSFLDGEYIIEIEVRNPDALKLSAVRLRESVTFVGQTQGITIDTASCHLTIGSDKTTYERLQGVDVSRDEELIAHCAVVSDLSAEKIVKPVVEIFHRSTFGDKVDTKILDQLLAGEMGNTYSFLVPLPDKPQAYDAVLSFQDGDGNTISSKATLHYVVQGESATIQNVTLDKDRYKVDDSAEVTVFWSGSADGFPGARKEAETPTKQMMIDVQLFNDQGETCSDVHNRDLSPEEITTSLVVPVTRACINPAVAVHLYNVEGLLLAERTYYIETKSQDEPLSISTGSDGITKVAVATLVIFVLLVITVIFISYTRRYKKDDIQPPSSNVMSSIVLAVLVAGGFFGNLLTASADTFAIVDNNVANKHTYYFTAGLDKSVYAPSEEIMATVSYVSGACNNDVLIGSNLYNIWARADGNLVFEKPNYSGSVNLVAPEVVGDYSVYISALAQWRSNVGIATGGTRLPYQVVSTGLSCSYNELASWGSSCSAPINGTLQSGELLQVDNIASGRSGQAAYYCEADGSLSLRSSWCDTTPKTGKVEASNCIIKVGGSGCESQVWWDSSGISSPVLKQDGNTILSIEPSGDNDFVIAHGQNTFQITDGYITFDSKTVTASCPPSTSWTGSVCRQDYDLSVITGPAVSGTLTQGQTVTFTAQSRNTGVNTINEPFVDQFTYKYWGTDFGYFPHVFPGDGSIVSPPFAPNAVQSSVSEPLLLVRSGDLVISYCADAYNQIVEVNERGSDNCKSFTFTVASGPVQPYGAIHARDCIIDYRRSTCESVMNWDAVNVSTTSVDIRITGGNQDFYYTNVRESNLGWDPYNWSKIISYGTNYVALIGDGAEIASDTAIGSCAPGLVWNVTDRYCDYTPGEPGTVDLISEVEPTVNGILREGETITFNARVKNVGGADVTSEFKNRFTYDWFSSGWPWRESFPINVSAPLSAESSRDDVSEPIVLDSYGDIWVNHCVDILNEIGEVIENNNCESTSFTVLPAGPLAGECGTGDGVVFGEFDSPFWYDGEQCVSSGSVPSNTNFPALGETVFWTCSGINGAPDSPQCSASRAAGSAPSADLTVTSCEVLLNQSTCDASVSWSSTNVTNPSVRQDGIEFSTNPADSVRKSLSIGSYYFTFYELSNPTPLDREEAMVRCESGASLNTVSGLCEATPNTPLIVFDTTPDIVRTGREVSIKINITSADFLECTLHGAQSAPITFSHDGATNASMEYQYQTKQLYSTQLVSVTCGVVGFPNVAETKTKRIQVVGTMEEL